MENQIVRDHLRRWAEELVDLTRRNRLLFFRHTASASFEFAQSASEVERGLGRTWGFHLPAPPPADPEVEVAAERPLPDALVVDMTPARDAVKIERGLKNLASKAQSEFLDSGIWVLYLGLGRLSWSDIDGKHASSPLLLVPVNLVQAGAGARWRLEASADGEPALNPALAVKLEKDFDIELPTLDDLPEADLASVLSAVRTAIADSDWSVADTAVLTTFTFQKEVIYRDLRDNEDVIVEHDMVRLLAEGPTSELAEALDFAPEDEGTLDTRHPPEDLVFVRDADATQRQSLIAARAGRSFVMDGPPGTGKSQTITNVIAQLITDGKTVLFVSEKAAALEVVQNRLAEHSLDPFVLALHSHNATRKAVAQDLGAALTDRSTARHRFSVADRAQLVADRERLSAYASAVNEVRSPLGLSVHDVIGRISQLDQLPQVEVPDVDVRTMSPSERAALRSAADQLARAWGPVERGEDFVWRNLQPTQGVGAREGDLRRRVERCRAALDTLADLTATHADELRVAAPAGPDGIESLFATLELVATRHAVGADWLTSEDTAGTTLSVTELALAAREVLHHGSRLDVLAPSWRDLGDTAADDVAFVDGLTASLRSQMPSIELPDAATDNDLLAAIAALETCATGLESSHGQVAHLGVTFGLEGEPSIAQANRLAELGQLVGSPSAPEPYWMNAAHRAALDEARRVLSDLLRTYRARRDALKGVFTEAALGADLEALHVRFAQVHTGLGKLGSAYRTDKKALAAVTVTGKVNKDVLGKLEEAIEWQQLSLRLSQAEVRHGPTIGARYYPSRADADLDEIERAVAVADRALALAAGEVDSEHLAGVLGRGSNPDPQVLASAGHVAAVLSAIEPTAGVIGHLTDFSEVVALPVSQAAAWCRSTATQLRNVVSWLDRAGQAGAVKQVAVMGDLLAARAEYQRQSDVLHAGSASLAQVLGPLRDRLDPDELDAAAAWVQSVHAQVGGPVRRRAATALLSTALTRPALDAAFTAFDKSRRDVLSPFGAPQAAEISAGLSGSFERTRELLDHLEATVSDATEWESHVAARAELAAAGWSSVVDACEEMTLQASAVGDVVERAILTRWIDQVLGADGRFTPSRSVDRDQLQAEFKALDAALVRDTAARVINACVARRPKSLVGQAGIINQQAQLKRRHKPVRRLLAEAGDAAQQLKPCFMMSPLSVSQFLPPGLRFDVVIFDEASQVREADAVCCVYRGEQLIVAGDPKQLPPTSFFQKTAEADEDDPDEEMLDFESILDRCKAQGFPALPLSWHYRSRHESLITFSNYSFYDGRLHTFPGATFEAPDLGVELFKVDGEYRRGATRDNPIEAEKVVDRIVFHRRHHPELTLGVVTLSVAQQVCVEAAIERRSPSEIELRQLMTDDRLDGFFVKNLENVQGDERDLIIISTG